MYGYIYKVENSVNNLLYIGKHKGTFDENYLGSGVAIKEAVSLLGVDKFKVTVLEYVNSLHEANNKERYWIHFYRSQNIALYNKGNGGEGGDIITTVSNDRYLQWKRNVAENSYFVTCTEDQRKLLLQKSYNARKHGKGWQCSEQTREKLRLSHIGHIHSEQAKKKISLARLGHTVSQETKDKIRKSNLGKKRTEETRKNMSLAQKQRYRNGGVNSFKGRHHTECTKQKIHDACMKCPHAGGRGSVWMHNDVCNKRVWPEDLEYYKSLGYIQGRLSLRKKDDGSSNKIPPQNS